MRVLRAVEEALDLGATALNAAWEVLSECGSMFSATVVFILERLLSRHAPLPYIMLAFGLGLMVEAALIE